MISPNSPLPTTEKSQDAFEPFGNATTVEPPKQQPFDPFTSNSSPQATVASPQANPFQQPPMPTSLPSQPPAGQKNDLTDLGDLFPSQPTNAQVSAGNSPWQTQQPAQGILIKYSYN